MNALNKIIEECAILCRLYRLHRSAPMSRRAALGLVMERVIRERQYSVKNIKKSF